MQTVIVNLTDEDGSVKEMTLSGVVIEKHLLLDGADTKVPIPAIITNDGKLRMIINVQFGYIDHEQYKEVKMANLGNMPLSILALEKYYVAQEQGKLELLWTV